MDIVSFHRAASLAKDLRGPILTPRNGHPNEHSRDARLSHTHRSDDGRAAADGVLSEKGTQ